MLPDRELRTCLCVLLACLPIACRAGGETITAAMRKDDSRLNQPVTARFARIYVGDLIERLTKQTGVTLRADRYDGAEDAQLLVSVRGVRLADCLDGLWATLSYKDAEYRWERTGKPGSYVYTLARSIGAQRLAERLRNLVQDLFEKHAERMLAAAASPDRRESIVRAMVADMFGGDEAMTPGLLASDRCWSGLATFSETLTPDAQLRVLRGEDDSVRVPVSQLSDAGRGFVHTVWQAAHAFRLHSDGSSEPVPEPGYVQFQASRGLTEEVSPTLFIEMEGIGGYGYLGGNPLEKVVRKRAGDMWMLPGDRNGDDKAGLAIPQASATARAGQGEQAVDRARSLERRLDQLAEAAGIPVIARLPHAVISDPGAPYGKTLGEYLTHVRELPPYVQVKWRGEAMLVDYPAWFHDEPDIVPLKIVKDLRSAAKQHDGYFTVRTLVDTARTVSKKWIERLADDFPTMASVAGHRDTLQALCPDNTALDQLQSEQGTPLTDALVAVLNKDQFLRGALERGRYQAVALRTLDHPDFKPPTTELCFGFITTEGKWVPVIGFNNQKNVLDSPEAPATDRAKP